MNFRPPSPLGIAFIREELLGSQGISQHNVVSSIFILLFYYSYFIIFYYFPFLLEGGTLFSLGGVSEDGSLGRPLGRRRGSTVRQADG